MRIKISSTILRNIIYIGYILSRKKITHLKTAEVAMISAIIFYIYYVLLNILEQKVINVKCICIAISGKNLRYLLFSQGIS